MKVYTLKFGLLGICILLLVACEEESKYQFNLSYIPAIYNCDLRYLDASHTSNEFSEKSFNVKVENARRVYTFVFDSSFKFYMPDISVEVTGVREHSWHSDYRADFKILENGYFKDTVTQSFWSGMDNYFYYGPMNNHYGFNLTLTGIDPDSTNILIFKGSYRR